MVFRELNKWNNIKEKCKYVSDKSDIDSLFFDMNGIISDKLHVFERNKVIDNIEEKEIFNILFGKIEIDVHYLNPKKIIGIFFDGVSPKAKMNLQRQRRIREFYKYKDKCSFNFNYISAGTEFMSKLSEDFKIKIEEKKKKDSIWKNVKVVFSGPEVPGEADYKIFEYIRDNKNSPSNGSKYEKRCIYTTDSDFYLLSLALHQRNILIYNIYNNNNCFNNSKKKNYFSVDKLRLAILELFPNTNKEEKNKIIDDFICLCFFTENNYLPGIYDVIFEDIVKIYNENYKTIGYINNNGRLNEENLKKYFVILNKEITFMNKMIYLLNNEMNNDPLSYNDQNTTKSNDEDDNEITKFDFVDNYIIKRDVFLDVQNLCKNSKLKYKDLYYKDPNALKFLKFLCSKFNLDCITGKQEIKIFDLNSENDIFWELKIYCNYNNMDINNLKNLNDEKKNSLIKKCEELNIKYKIIKYFVISKKEDYDNNGVNIFKKLQLKINEYDNKNFFKNIKENYYKKNIPNYNKKELINEYIKGIKWMLSSYYDKVPSWSWFYKYRYWKNKSNSYGPFISDLCNFEVNNDFKFDQGEPLCPFTQLLTILPSESFDLLPSSYKKILNNNEVKKLYPKIDSFPDKSSMFKVFSSIPLLDSNKYKEYFTELNKSLSNEELARNSFGCIVEYHTYNEMKQMEIKNQCIILSEKKNYKDALNIINKLIEKRKSADNYCSRAKIYLNMRRYKDAMNDCNNALKKNRKCVKANIIYAQCHIHRGNLEKAKENIEKGLEISKDNNNLSDNIPRLKDEFDNIVKLENSFEDVNKFIKEKKYKDALHKLENIMLLCDNELKPILSSNEKLSKLKSDDLKGIPIQWRLLRAELFIMNDDYNEALNIAEIILNSPGNSKNSEANTLKTKLLYIMGKSNIENTINYLRKALKNYENNENAKILIKKIPELDERRKYINENFFKKELYDETIQKYDELIDEYKEIKLTGVILVILLRNKSSCLIKLNKCEECIECTNEAIKILKNIVFLKGEPESINEYENCKQNSLFNELFRKRSECFMKLEKFQEAKNDYEILKIMKSTDNKIDYEELYKKMENAILSEKEREYGNEAFRKGKYEDALKYYDKSLEFYDKNSKSYCNRGLIYMKLFKYNDAIINFKNAYRCNNKYYKAIINISKCYLQILQPNKALSELEELQINSNERYYEDYYKELERVKRINNAYSKIFRHNFMINNEDYESILKIYKKEYIADYVEVIILKKQAENSYNNDEKEECIKYCSKSIKKLNDLLNNTSFEYDSNNSHGDIYEELFNKRAECYMKLGKYHEAINDYEILIKLDKNSNEFDMFYFGYKTDYKEKLRRAKKYIMDMEEAEDYKKEGTKAYNSREYKKAIDLYTKAISKYPTINSIYYNNRAAANMMAFKYKDAINDCLIAIGSDKKYILAYKRISTCYFQLNDPDSAEEILEKGLKSCPGNCELQEKLNIAKDLKNISENIQYYRIYNYEKAIEQYNKLLKKYTENKITGYIEVLLYKNIANLYQNLKNIRQCIVNISTSINILCKLLFGNDSGSADQYKNSDFCDLFTELFKVRAKNYMDYKCYDEAYDDYYILYHMNPYDNEIKRNLENAKTYKNFFRSRSRNSSSSSQSNNSKSDNNSDFSSFNSSTSNYYKILGLDINDNPSLNEIKKAYHKLAFKYHPDKCKNENKKKDYEEKMKKINIAYEKLLKKF